MSGATGPGAGRDAGALAIGGIRNLRGEVRFAPEAEEWPEEADGSGLAAGRNGWMTPETLARHTDARMAEKVRAVCLILEDEEARAPRGDGRWHSYQGHAARIIAELEALDRKWGGAE